MMDDLVILSGMATAIVSMAGFIIYLVKVIIKQTKDSTKVLTELKSSIDAQVRSTDRIYTKLFD
jgi:hypothetical protein